MTVIEIEKKEFTPFDKVKIWLKGNADPVVETLYTGHVQAMIHENLPHALLTFKAGRLKGIDIETIADIQLYQ